jgi:hypothetical protein
LYLERIHDDGEGGYVIDNLDVSSLKRAFWDSKKTDGEILTKAQTH